MEAPPHSKPLGNLQPATALYLPEAAPSKGLRPDASFSGIKADVTSSSPPSASQPPSSHTSAATRRTADEMLTALRKGTDLLKHGRLGKPKMHFFRLAEGDSVLTWRSANGKPRSIPLASVKQVIKGQLTEIFKRHPLPHMAHASFSLMYIDLDLSSRTLDLTCRNQQEFDLWYWGIQAIKDRLRAAGTAHRVVMGAPTGGALVQPAKSLQGQPVGSQPPSSTAKVVGGGTVQGRVTGAMGLPVPEQRPGDCYVWGSSDAGIPPAQGSICDRQQSATPAIVEDSTHLDVCQVAVGLRHAALVTRSGEVYTWGNGAGGKLGLGHATDACAPQRVDTLWGQRIRSIVAGDACTAVVSEEGFLYTWGDGAAGNLGYSNALRQFIPRRVEGTLLDHTITQVSCGPYHSAALSSTGALFTWGDGLCGKLGHGCLDSCLEPRQVDALKDKRVLHVACGVWHTAAIAAGPIGGSSLPSSLSELSFQEAEALRHKLSAAYSMLDEEGGALFTWGGHFTWVDHRKNSAGHPVDKRDHHRGCLGHGDTAGCLAPTRVGGALQGLAVRQVECGLNLTVALTADGRIWQMGETGAPGHKLAPWEGAREAVQVPIPDHYVERIAVGMQHAAALAGPLDGQTGRAEEGAECSVIFTWGRGREGQLGVGMHADSAIPAPVDELRGRHVLQVACGGCHTLAVCRHDADKEDTEERRRGYKGKMRAWFSNNSRPLVAVPEKVEMHALKLPRDSGGIPLSEDHGASTSGSLASFTANSEASTPRSVRAGVRKSAHRRASLAAGARAFSTSLAQQLRRHSGDAYAASQRLLAGAKSSSASPSDVSGPRRATSPEMEAASSTSLAETSASLPEPLTSEAPGLDFQHPQQALIRRGATDAATSQGSGDSAQDEKSYIAVLENRVARLEVLLGQNTAVPPSHSNQPQQLPMLSPFRTLPSTPGPRGILSGRRHSAAGPFTEPAKADGLPSAQLQEPEGSQHGSSRGPGEEAAASPVRRILQLSPERSNSLSPRSHRRSHSLADWSASAAPLWQPHDGSSSPAALPAPDSYSQDQRTSTSSSAEAHSRQQHQQPAHAAGLAAVLGGRGDGGFFGRPGSPVIRTATIDVGALMGGRPRSHMGSPRGRLHSPTAHASPDRDSSREIGPHSWLRPGVPSPQTSAANEAESGGDGAWALQQEREELAQIRAQLEVREARLRAREQQLKSENSSGMEGGFGPPAAACAVPSAEGDDAPKTGLEHTVEPSEGVFLTLQATPLGQNALTRIRFARGRFSKAQAEAWWRAHKAEVAERYNLAPGSPRVPSAGTESPRGGDTSCDFGTLARPFSSPSEGLPFPAATMSAHSPSTPNLGGQSARQLSPLPRSTSHSNAQSQWDRPDRVSSGSYSAAMFAAREGQSQQELREQAAAAAVPVHSASAEA